MIWPLPALLAWAAAWGLFLALQQIVPIWLAIVLATALGVAAALLGSTRWRSVFIAVGFPLSLLASGLAAGVPGWVWLFPLAAIFALYPVHAWRDAPVFPTPRGALAGLERVMPLPPGTRILDGGCGLGDGLRELQSAYPGWPLDGIEWSWPLTLGCRLRCRWLGVKARVARGDLWAADWSAYGLVYLFQRPESMDRAVQKASAELAPGAWLASLEFEATTLHPTAVFACPDGRPVWLYQLPLRPR